MQRAAAEPGVRRPAHQQQHFAGVDLRRPKGYAGPAPAEGDPCPRCESLDTKFCYYNNYNTSQPRYFCKGCRRYWTKGGTLRNVPVGGGTRKKPSSAPPSSYAAAAANADRPRKPYKKKRRVVVAAAEPLAAATVVPATVGAAAAADTAKTTTNETAAATPTTTEAASEITTELVVPAAAEVEDSLAHLLQPDVALGLGISDFPAAGKALDLELDSFEWPALFDLGGACWGSAAGFADPDPAGMFLNLP